VLIVEGGVGAMEDEWYVDTGLAGAMFYGIIFCSTGHWIKKLEMLV